MLHENELWTKNDKEVYIGICSYDGEEVSEVVRNVFIEETLCYKYNTETVGLYRDDGKMMIKSKSNSLNDRH